MTAWKASPYRAVGIYIGGVSRGCAQPNLTAAWVRQQVTAGWKLLPIYVGPQASCSGKKNLIDNATAGAQGTAAASDAATQATSLGLARQSVLIYDLEAYPITDAACRKGVLAFMNAWTVRLHDLGYHSGFYSSVSSGVADQVTNYTAAGYTRPDFLDFARWDLKVTLTDTAIPSTSWASHRRMKQYRGGHTETFGGVTINIDSNYVDFAPLPAAKMADFNNNGWSDVLARSTANGWLYHYPGSGRVLAPGSRRALSSGWNSRWSLGASWGGLRDVTGVGDFDRDGYSDIVAVRTRDTALTLFRGTGKALRGGVVINAFGGLTPLA